MSDPAFAQVQARAVAILLLANGGSPPSVARVTDIPLRFAQRLAREFGTNRSSRSVQDDIAELWSTPERFIQTTLFGMCLHRVENCETSNDRARALAYAYYIYRGVFSIAHGISAPALTVDETIAFYRAYRDGLVVQSTCGHCMSTFWVLQRMRTFDCPSCSEGSDGKTKPVKEKLRAE